MSAIIEPELENLANIHNFAALDLVHIKLLLPQSEIKTLEPGFDVKDLDGKKESEKSITLDGKQLPVYCFGPDLLIIQTIPDEYRVCAIVNSEKYCFGILCNQVITIEQSQLKFFSMPGCMHTVHSPLLALAQYEGQVICVSSTVYLAKYIHKNT
ncbi:MAG: hypothetical protein V3V89_04650 [Gammaproteobacteria bacterium]